MDRTDQEIHEIIKAGERARRDLEDADTLPTSLVLKEKYYVACPYCGENRLTIKPSLFMQLGINLGGAQCKACRKMFQIRIDPRINEAVTVKMEVPGA
jgi:transcription elongation factor Elf1